MIKINQVDELIVKADNFKRFSVDSIERFIYVLTYRQAF